MIKLNVDRQRIYSDIKTITGYMAAGSGDYDNIVVTEDEENLIKAYWDEAYADLVGGLSGFNPGVDGDTINLPTPVNISPNADKNAGMEIVDFMVNSIVSRWLSRSGNELSKDYGVKAMDNLANMRKILYTRIKPIER